MGAEEGSYSTTIIHACSWIFALLTLSTIYYDNTIDANPIINTIPIIYTNTYNHTNTKLILCAFAI